MNKIIVNILCGAFILVIASCNRSNTKYEKVTFSQDIFQKISINPGEKGDISFKDIYDTTLYIKLETLQDVTIGSIDKIIFSDSKIFIGDFENTKSIYCFNSSGKYLAKIQNIGRGPDQYSSIDDFDVDNKLDRIVLSDSRSKAIFIYDYSGRLIAKHSNNYIFSFFKLINSDEVLAYSEYITNFSIPDHPNSNIFILDYKKGRIKSSLLQFKEALSLEYKIAGVFNNISYSDNTIYIYDYYTNAIYTYSNNMFTNKWQIDFGNKNLPKTFWNNTNNYDSEKAGIKEGKFCSGLINFQIINNYIIGIYEYRSDVHTFIYDRDQNLICTSQTMFQKSKSEFPVFLFPNFHTDSKNIVSVLEPVMLNNIVNSAPDNIVIPEELRDIDINNNPVLQIIKLK